VRNFQARNNLRAMKKGDVALFYHSGDEKRIVGTASVEREAYADPTADEGDWSAVDLKPLKPIPAPVSLVTVKSDKVLKEMLLARNSRLSVSPVSKEQFERILELGKAKL
ncbi:MAG TPA: EVE domain-containing protein, partial [Verrucomicrobiae bacterium]